jgi:L-asparaginase II
VTAALGPTGAVELAIVERSGFDESSHLGAAVLTGADGAPVRELGDVRAAVFARSSLKPFQAIASLRAGAPLTDRRLAIAVASHTGTPAHVELVRRVLATSGLGDADLQCTPAWPGDHESRDALVALGDHPRPVYMACSGKHAGFLAACVASGWSTQDHLDPAHPMQRAVVDTIRELTDEPIEVSGVDGCGAPVHATSIAGTALAMSRVARGEVEHGAALMAAVLADGWVVDGPGRADTVVIDELGLFAKHGAEGFQVVAAPTGEVAAVKVLDGSSRAAMLVALELLAQGGVIDRDAADRVLAQTTPPVLGGGRPVGRVRAAFSA